MSECISFHMPRSWRTASPTPRIANGRCSTARLRCLQPQDSRKGTRGRPSRRFTTRGGSGSGSSRIFAHPDNQLNDELRANLISIAIWILKRNGKDPQTQILQFPGHHRHHHHHQGWTEMKSTLRISLKSGERIFVNGAVLARRPQGCGRIPERRDLPSGKPRAAAGRCDDAAEAALFHRPDDPDQSGRRRAVDGMFRKSVVMLLNCFKNEEILAELKRVDGMVTQRPRLRCPEGDPWPLRHRGPHPQQPGNRRRQRSSRFARRSHHGGKRRQRQRTTHRIVNDVPIRPRTRQGAAELRQLPQAARRADEEPGSDRADGCHASRWRSSRPSRRSSRRSRPTRNLESLLQRTSLSEANAVIGKTVTSADGKTLVSSRK